MTRAHKIEDDRTPQQTNTHTIGIAMTDKFMSGWGGAEGGASVAIWACQNESEAYEAERWVRSRSDASRVRQVNLRKYRPATTTAHTHIYVWRDRGQA